MISVIIPVLNDTTTLIETLEVNLAIREEEEYIIVDGGSASSPEQAAEHLPHLHFLKSLPNRAQQMNAGAASARGDILLFLHADTRLPKGWQSLVKQAAMNPTFSLGAFRFSLFPKKPSFPLIEWGVNWRTTYWKLPYGDQALFMLSSDFKNLGGYKEMPLMEDVDLVKRARKKGAIVILPKTIQTSSRRWQKDGALKRTLKNWSIYWRYRLGVSPNQLAKEYNQNSCAILIFCKYPIPGQVKTRLGNEIGHDTAAEVYRRMVDHTLKEVSTVKGNCTPLIFHAHEQDQANIENWLGRYGECTAQKGDTLGDRMSNAFETCFDSGYNKALVIGTDCPDLTHRHLEDTFQKLEEHEVVIGPTEDGGYFLLGLTKPRPELFRDMPWSTDQVFSKTRERLTTRNISHHHLESLRDLDFKEDFDFYVSKYPWLNSATSPKPKRE